MLDEPAQSFEVSFTPGKGLANEQGKQKQDNPER